MRSCILVLVLAQLLFLALPSQQTVAQEICFPEQPAITHCLADTFSSYWESNGGLAVFGYPLTPATMQPQLDLEGERLTQWLERSRLEYHPENAAPYNILMGRLGADRLIQLGRDPTQQPREPGPIEGCLWFEVTGHNVCDQAPGLGFSTYWQTHGLRIAGLSAYEQSLQLFGYPLTSAQYETNPSGLTVLTQWFERARFEWYPDQPDQYKVQLGLLGNELAGIAQSPPVFGVELSPGTVGNLVQTTKNAGVTWVRYHDLDWAAVEPNQGARQWGAIARAENELQVLTAQGLMPIVVVSNVPAWAQRFPGVSCGPIKPEALDAFASFMRDLAARNQNVRYWEIGNEPDIAPGLVPNDSVFGCWGDASDPYYGGGYYAEMLKRVYPAIKQGNPAAQVVIGGLLLDCNPENPPAGKDCLPAKFFEGVLRNGGGAVFDVVAYHSYAFWGDSQRDWDLYGGNWMNSGGGVIGKLTYLRSVMQRYGVVKQVMLNEAALLCYNRCPADRYEAAKANYLVRLFTRAKAQGLLNTIWFTMNSPGWRGSGLLDANQVPLPSYHALQTLSARLSGADYAGSISNGALEGYYFVKGDKFYQVVWTNDGSRVPITLSSNMQLAYTHVGEAVTIADSRIEVGFEPIIIEGTSYRTFLNVMFT